MSEARGPGRYISGIRRKAARGDGPGDASPETDNSWRELRLYPAESTIPMPSLELQARVGPAPAFHDVALNTMGRMNMAGLRPEHDVLDIGCGVGRTARYLCDFLEPTAHYEGFDIMEEMILWCQQEITPRFPNFRFVFAPLFNSAYRRDPALPSAESFVFPYGNESFDFAFAHSVFTHLPPAPSRNYLSEVNRVLRPGGILYATWFLFTDDLESNPNPLVSGMHLDASGGFAIHDPSVPDTAVANREDLVRDAYSSSGLTIEGPVHPGFRRLQDAIVAIKAPPSR
jgi:SAM-dependent methyltransferase